jgi:DNA polymerase elongation subunit (family B)
MNVCLFNGTVQFSNLLSYSCDSHVPNSEIKPDYQHDHFTYILYGRNVEHESVAIVLTDWCFQLSVLLTPGQAANLEQGLKSIRALLPPKTPVTYKQGFCAFGYAGDGTTRTQRTFAVISLTTANNTWKCRRALTNAGYEICEMDTFTSSHHEVFMLQQLLENLPLDSPDVAPCSWFSWVRLPVNASPSPGSATLGTTKHEFYVSWHDLRVLPTSLIVPKLRICSFDIEVASPSASFPTFDVSPVTTIGSVIWSQDACGFTGIVERTAYAFSLQPDIAEFEEFFNCTIPESEATYTLKRYNSERAMIVAWRDDIVIRGDIDVFTGYNIWGFDVPFLVNRMKLLDSGSRFFRFGRLFRSWVAHVKANEFSSSARGDQTMTLFDGPGFHEIDVFIVAKSKKFSDYSLKAVSNATLDNLAKGDMPYTEITPAHLNYEDQRLAAYCIRDCELPLWLMEKWGTVAENVAVSQVSCTPMGALISKGQSVKVQNMMRGEGHRMGAVFNSVFFEVTGYEGATVVVPMSGFYTSPIPTLDFSSLYPSMMIQNNLCCSTLVANASSSGLDPSKYAMFPVIPQTPYCFVKTSTAPGIIPSILRNILAARTVAKNMLKQAWNNSEPTHVKKALNSRQLALKISANSVYGVLAKLCLPVSATTTWCGRNALQLAITVATSAPYHADVIYGDSVTGDTALVVRVHGVVTVCRIDDLDNLCPLATWARWHDDKESTELEGVDVWQDGGFTPVRRVIRHFTQKPIWRVLTHTGVVDCTADHSLLTPTGAPITPAELTPGSLLLHEADDADLLRGFGDCPLAVQPIVDLEEAFAMGLFAADGSCGAYSCPSGDLYSWAIDNANLALLEATVPRLPFPAKILDCMGSFNVYKLVPVDHVKPVVLRYRTLFYDSARSKRIPPEIMYAPLPVVHRFLDGFFAGDSHRGEQARQTSYRIDQKNKTTVAGLWLLCRRAGYQLSLNDCSDKPDVFRLTAHRSTSSYRRPPTAVKKVTATPLHAACLVYDLQTDSHHFGVAPGNLVVHNTDSIMIKFPQSDPLVSMTREEAKTLSLGVGAAVTKHFHDENSESVVGLEYEKTYQPYLLAKKKRYAGLMYSDDGIKLDIKGFEVVRKDTARFFALLLSEIFEILMKVTCALEVPATYQTVLQAIDRTFTLISSGQLPIELIVSSKSLRREYKNPKGVTQWVVNQHIDQVDPGYAFAVGDRVPFVILQAMPIFPTASREATLRGCSNSGITDRAIYPPYCTRFPVFGENIDWLYYLDRTRATLLQILRLVSPSTATRDYDLLYKDHAQRITRGRRTFSTFAHMDITKFCKPVAPRDDIPELYNRPVQYFLMGEDDTRGCKLPKAPKVQKNAAPIRRAQTTFGKPINPKPVALIRTSPFDVTPVGIKRPIDPVDSPLIQPACKNSRLSVVAPSRPFVVSSPRPSVVAPSRPFVVAPSRHAFTLAAFMNKKK